MTTPLPYWQAKCENVRRALEARGMKGKELAERTGKSPSYVSEVCTSKQPPSDDFLRRAAEELFVPEEWLHVPHDPEEPVPGPAAAVEAEAAPDPTDLAPGRVVGSYDPDVLPVPIPYGLLELKRHLGEALTQAEFAYLYGFVDPTVSDRGAQRADRWGVDQWFKVLRHHRDRKLRPGGEDG